MAGRSYVLGALERLNRLIISIAGEKIGQDIRRSDYHEIYVLSAR
jgi:hypothetical protein